MRDFIQRMPFQVEGRQIFESLSTGWYNTYSITVMMHQKVNNQHKLLFARIEKEVKLPWMETISARTYHDSEQIEAILTKSNAKTNGYSAKNTLMAVMAHRLDQLYRKDVEIL